MGYRRCEWAAGSSATANKWGRMGPEGDESGIHCVPVLLHSLVPAVLCAAPVPNLLPRLLSGRLASPRREQVRTYAQGGSGGGKRISQNDFTGGWGSRWLCSRRPCWCFPRREQRTARQPACKLPGWSGMCFRTPEHSALQFAPSGC